MKRILLVFVMFTQFIIAQNKKPIDDLHNFVPGELIVQLKDNIQAKITYDKTGKGTTGINIGEMLGIEAKVAKTSVLFSERSVQKSIANKLEKRKDSRLPEIHSLKNTFVLELNDKQENIMALVEELRKNPDVEYAEPNYNYSVNDFTIDSEVMTSDEVKKSMAPLAPDSDDPFFPQQSNIQATNLDKVWDTYTTGDGSQIIAILDTGIDYEHPDLKPNIWINDAELNGVDGFDDDGNGYIDDIRGWDFINIDNAPLDDNMHGTHVAGIAGAVGDNGLGIAGAAWNVKLMPIKVFQSNGVGNASTIAQGIAYATNNGATIQNMSFGSYAESITMRNALENAYATSVLVAAAGNDALCIGPGKCNDGRYGMPSYPGAYTYVIGIEDNPKPLFGYTNYDQDGPIFSGYSNLLNYELTAPGTGIMSTVPNGGYRKLTGTSMASPLVAGGIALYLQQNPDDSTELLFGNLINTAGTYVDFLAAIEVIPTPELKVLSAMTKDTINSQNGNDYLEPNEIIEVFPLIKNYWGPTDDVRVGIEFAEFEDQTKATIIENEIAIGSITAYATLQDLTKSLKIQIADGVANNVNIKFNLRVWSGDTQEYLSSMEFVINIKNAIILEGYITTDLTLTPDKEYIFEKNIIISNNSTLTIEPGTKIKMGEGIRIVIDSGSKLLSNGTKANNVIIEGEGGYWNGIISNNQFGGGFEAVLNFTHLKDAQPHEHLYPTFRGSIIFNDCLITGMQTTITCFGDSKLNNCNIIEGNIGVLLGEPRNYKPEYNYSNFSNLYWRHSTESPLADDLSPRIFLANGCNIFNNFCLNSIDKHSLDHAIFKAPDSPGVYDFNSDNYFGTSSVQVLKKYVKDYSNSNLIGIYNFDTKVDTPFEEAHGVVWKVLVNGKDAQDEYDLMDPVGVGIHTFDVYFNRAMDTDYPPQISYGVREPYNQKIISEAGTWSADAKIYSVTHDVNIGSADGINRIRVQGARDLDYFDIPVEDYRFNMLVQSSGSASAGFAATPGLGEITLDWEVPDETLLEDVLGYNMYRYKAITDTTFTDALKINDILISDPLFVDFQVEEGEKYFYQYKILRTSFEETDFSKTVAASPLTSKLGDSNGDFDVNVMDLVQDVDYILGNNPTPFIFKAADVNDDTFINVLDIVGTVDIILNPSAAKVALKGSQSINYFDNNPIGDAIFYWEENDLYVESKEVIAGIQLAFDKGFSYTLSDMLPNFEWLNYPQDDQQIIMMYSFGNVTIPAGKTKILTKTSENEVSFDIDKAVVAASKGLKLNAIFDDRKMIGIEAPVQTDQANMILMGPNPTDGLLNIYYYLPEKMDKVLARAYSLNGTMVWSNDAYKNTPGQTKDTLDLSSLNNGIYIVVIDVLRAGEIKKREVKRIVISK